MAINPDDFIFHSDLVPRQQVFKKSVNVAISGSIGGGAYRVFESAWIDMGSALQDIDIYATIPGVVYAPSATDATFMAPVEISLTADSAVAALMSTVQNGSSIKCQVSCLNWYGYATTVPSKTITFTIKGYLPPAIT